jgi:hypothetical protein
MYNIVNYSSINDSILSNSVTIAISIVEQLLTGDTEKAETINIFNQKGDINDKKCWRCVS